MEKSNSPLEQLRLKFGESVFTEQHTKDEVLTLWLPLDRLKEVLTYLKSGISKPYLSLVENSKTKDFPSDAKLSLLERTLKFPTGSLLAHAHQLTTRIAAGR